MYGWALHEFSKGRISIKDIEEATENFRLVKPLTRLLLALK